MPQTMTSGSLPRRGAGRVIGGCVVGAVLGALYPFLLSAQVLIPAPVIFLTPILTAWLYVWAGTAAAATLNAVQTALMLAAYGPALALASAMATVLPSLPMLSALQKRQPFFDQLERGGILSVLGLALAVGVAYLAYGGGLIAQLIDAMSAMTDAMPDEMLLLSLTMGGVDASAMDPAQMRDSIAQLFEVAKTLYSTLTPGTLVSGSVLSAVFAVSLGNRMLARRGLCTTESYVTMENWRLPARISLSALGALLAGYAAASMSISGGQTIYYLFYDLGLVAFGVQAACSLARRLGRAGMRRGGAAALSAAIVVALCLFGLSAVPIAYGVASAMFGASGAIRGLIEKNRNKDKDKKN